jgi:hypothetical protein
MRSAAGIVNFQTDAISFPNSHLHAIKIQFLISLPRYRVFFFRLADKRRPNAPPDALPALRLRSRVGAQSVTGARQARQ